jgi:ATP-dependent Clp protease ATP-binding subunit ClpA
VAISALKTLGLRTADLRKSARAALPADTKRRTANPALGRSTVKALDLAEREALRLGSTAVDTEHLLLGLLGDADSAVANVFAAAGQDYAAVRRAVAREATAERPVKKAAKRAR